MCKTSLADDGVLWFCLSSDLSPWLFFQLVEEAVPALATDCVPYFLLGPLVNHNPHLISAPCRRAVNLWFLLLPSSPHLLMLCPLSRLKYKLKKEEGIPNCLNVWSSQVSRESLGRFWISITCLVTDFSRMLSSGKVKWAVLGAPGWRSPQKVWWSRPARCGGQTLT